MSQWTADITNDPNRDFDLYIEILENEVAVARLARENDGTLSLCIYPTENEVRIPAQWLLSVITSAEADLVKT